ncbi:ABC transporter ATP-binding protein [Haloimpatiens sp. FM7315]|uniref:ABC transporter ATP-binding protein n=1 Tax=Haloimpatiens sp. FM7315 TaxID=3298609 RepID=UPI0039776600
MEVINIKGVSFSYPESKKKAINNINLKINEGEFVLIVGPSGCGKSTLIRLINRLVPDFYGGLIEGEVYLKGNNVEKMSRIQIVKNVGMVYQHPEKQIILQDVEREIAFGLENLNVDINTMKRNVAEVISLLGLTGIKNKKTDEISGGEKQRVAIASVVSMDPDIIILDEPISQLDPIAAEEILNSIKRLNNEFGKTVILVEQRLDKCFLLADRIIYMEKGSIIAESTGKNIPRNIDKRYHLPSLTYIFKKAGAKTLPLSVKEGRRLLDNVDVDKFKSLKKESSEDEDSYENEELKDESLKEKIYEKIVEVKKLNFSYEKGKETLKDINFSLNKKDVMCVMGENGAGKSTLFKILAGIIRNYKGNILINNQNIKSLKLEDLIEKIGYLSQNPNDYFGRDTVFNEVSYTLKNIGKYSEKKVMSTLNELDLLELKDRNPRDLSGGEKQRVAIACTLVVSPEVLILDEPTRGMDAIAKENLGKLIKELSSIGKTIILITHDIDFASDYCNRAMILFNGEIVARGKSQDIIYDSIYYSSQIAKLFKNKAKVIKSQDAFEILKVIM